MLKAIHKNIKSRRKALKMTQSQLAEKLGYADKSMIAKIEAGLVNLPQSRIEAFAQALGVTKEELTGWSDKTVSESFGYFLEQQMTLLGCNVVYSTDGDVILCCDGAEYEITDADVRELEETMDKYLRYQLFLLMKKSRKIGG
jgi:transcriptional regulator with XRE-family HTH domain